jgi:chromosome segregation ATPase
MTLSKTAAAAQKAVERGQQQNKEVWTAERTIKNIRQLREACLAVPVDQLDVLLAEYDKTLQILRDANTAVKSVEAEVLVSKQQLVAAQEQIERWQDEFGKMVEIRDSYVKRLDEANAQIAAAQETVKEL